MINQAAGFEINPVFLGGLSSKRAENSDKTPASEVSQTRMKAAVKELEALFIYELLKEMRKSTQGGLLGKGLGNDIYSSLFDMEMARMVAGRGIGLGESILKQLNGRTGKGESDPSIAPKDEKAAALNGLEKQPVPESSPRSGLKDPKAIPSESSLRIPVDGPISSHFGLREDPLNGKKKFHGGIDIAAPLGQEIFPIKKGRVIFSGLTQGYGNTLVIDHGDGYISKYAHNLTNLVTLGDEVDSDQAIALIGSTGRSTGPHLHLEIQFKGEKINPLKIVQGQPEAVA